ncbi:MAG: type I-C CRISPR-associated protein Cas8c/Csd1 [Acidobacteria bacterium]|nr:MAG: type I-C CRISPR-associated protein Cas8c/Csd1 [Acidobacteriota bacterium]
MSWIEQLRKTYDACYGQERPGFSSLAAISTVPQTTQLHILLHSDGTLQHASLDELSDTAMFVTEDSASRSGSEPAANPLTDQLEYCAKEMEKYGGKADKHERYVELLTAWAESEFSDPKIVSVQKYIASGALMKDLLERNIISIRDGSLQKVRVGSKSLDPLKLWVRWSVGGALQNATWLDPELAQKWEKFETAWSQTNSGVLGSKRERGEKKGDETTGLCMVTGEITRIARKHPKRIRSSGDGSKLISSNDDRGFTFRGRFECSEQAVGIGYEASQKAHNALRWLINRQNAGNDQPVVVAWEQQGAPLPPILVDSWKLITDAAGMSSDDDSDKDTEISAYDGDAGQHYALRLRMAIHGYKQKLSDNARIVIMELDSASDGRMAILFYRELNGSELLDRVKWWHYSQSWKQTTLDGRFYWGAPSPRSIAEVIFGQQRRNIMEVEPRILRITQERLLPCIIDGLPLPNDLVQNAVRKAITSAREARGKDRSKLRYWLFERNLGVACWLYRAAHPKENYSMSLEEARTSRDYLYGRLLAVADDIESKALWLAKQERETSAARLMQRFADHPCSTWRTLELQLRPYIAQLRSSRPGFVAHRLKLTDAIVTSFENQDGSNAFLDNHPLSGEFLLGYHSQREALRSRKANNESEESNGGDASEQPEQQD